MIPFFIGAILGGFVGIMATACCAAASDGDMWRDGYKHGKADQLEQVRSKLRECDDCVYRIRYIERGE